MIKCDNCERQAEYISDPEFASTAYFCGSCIPWSLLNEFKAGLLPRVPQEEVAEAPAEPVLEAVVEETPVVEELPVEAPVEAPVTSKKKKSTADDSSVDVGSADDSDN